MTAFKNIKIHKSYLSFSASFIQKAESYNKCKYHMNLRFVLNFKIMMAFNENYIKLFNDTLHA